MTGQPPWKVAASAPRDFMIIRWPHDGRYHIERGGVELVLSFSTFEDALEYAQGTADQGSEIGTNIGGEWVYRRAKRGGWKRHRVEWIDRSPCAADCPNSGMDGACLHCGGGYRRVDPNRFLEATEVAS